MIYLKLHNTESGNMLAMCDSALIEMVLSEGDIEINLKDYSEFYTGQLLSKEKALEFIQKEEIISANIVGVEAVKVGLKRGIIEKENIKKVNKIPYACAVRIN
jgi:hypothetical protein